MSTEQFVEMARLYIAARPNRDDYARHYSDGVYEVAMEAWVAGLSAIEQMVFLRRTMRYGGWKIVESMLFDAFQSVNEAVPA